jgi:hypothetical protein
MPLAVVEAKANKHEVGKGMQQGMDYAKLLEVPFVFASNGDGFVFRDLTNTTQLESEIRLEDFRSPQVLWRKYCVWKGYKEEHLLVITQDYYDDGSGSHHATIRFKPSIKRLKQLRQVKIEFCWSWQQEKAKSTRHYKSFGACVKKRLRNEFNFSRQPIDLGYGHYEANQRKV